MTEHLTTTPVTIEGLTGDPHTDPDVILDKAGDDSSTEKARLEALSWALERYNRLAPVAARCQAARRDRDRALHLVETRWEALSTSTTTSTWVAAHHQYVTAVHDAHRAISTWHATAIHLWGVEPFEEHTTAYEAMQAAYQTRILAAGHPPADVVEHDPDPEAHHLHQQLDAAHRTRQAITMETLTATQYETDSTAEIPTATGGSTDCTFCRIISGDAPATIVAQWPDAIAIVPLNPVVEDLAHGHVLVIPRRHVADFVEDPDVTGATARRAAQLARTLGLDVGDANLITSKGRWATQTVGHLHYHLVPRRCGDGLPLPWTPQQTAEETKYGKALARRG